MPTIIRCESCGEEYLKDDDMCPKCGSKPSLGASRRKKRTIIRSVHRPKQPIELILGITIDRTSSSKEFSAGIPVTIETILKMIEKQVHRVRVFVQLHGDLECKGEEEVWLTTDGSPDQTIRDLSAIEYGGGGDPEETHLDSIYNLYRCTPWGFDSSRTRGVMLAIMNDETKTFKREKYVTIESFGKELISKGILTYMVCNDTARLRQFARSSQAMTFKISNEPQIGDLEVIAQDIVKSIVASVSGGHTVPLMP